MAVLVLMAALNQPKLAAVILAIFTILAVSFYVVIGKKESDE